jgi:predicted nucleic acid-binding protein
MGPRYLLDSNTVIDFIARLHPDKGRQWLNMIVDEEIIVSVITQIEVLSFNPGKDDNYPVLVDFFENATIFDLTGDVVSKTIQIRQKQKIKLPDAVIAATALCNGFTLVTRDVKDFKNVKGLQVIDPHSL